MDYGVLFVCTGNICRSPTAAGAFRHVVRNAGLQNRVLIDSAGTHGYHIGEAPDHRAITVAQTRGIDISDLRARQFTREDFDLFDLILAMDEGHFKHIQRMMPANARAETGLFLDFLPDAGRRDVPDPYYGGTKDFEYVLDLVERGSNQLLEVLQKKGAFA